MNNKIKVAAIVVAGIATGAVIGTKLIKSIKTRRANKKANVK